MDPLGTDVDALIRFLALPVVLFVGTGSERTVSSTRDGPTG
ncbi:hypothetical protein [Halostagnicola sp. A-GB9-2]|nr:hypothetical protein [Halostagnicola sp. A-GB9-2]MDJ1432924.1 hypothetical protein [Halostagnicola sp. A-GB9-2]